MITQNDEYFSQNWEECLYVIEAAKVLMGDKDPCPVGWEEEMMSKWIAAPPEPEPEPEAEPPTEEEVKEKEAAKEAAEADRLMGKFEKWEDIRKHLWFYYTDEETRSKPTTIPCWQSDED